MFGRDAASPLTEFGAAIFQASFLASGSG